MREGTAVCVDGFQVPLEVCDRERLCGKSPQERLRSCSANVAVSCSVLVLPCVAVCFMMCCSVVWCLVVLCSV